MVRQSRPRRVPVAVDFLRTLDLDPVAILGGAEVEAADAWRYEASPSARFPDRKADSARPIGAHNLVVTT